MVAKFSNEASTTLAAAVAATDTTITVAANTGGVFPPLTVTGDYFYAALFNATTVEIIKVTAISTDTLTAARGQDGTTAASFAAGDGIELRVVAANMASFVQEDASNSMPVPATAVETNYPRVNSTGTAYELRAPAQVLADIGAQPAGNYASAGGTPSNTFWANTGTNATEADIGAICSGVSNAYLYNSPTAWGIYSADGGAIISYTRSGASVQIGGGKIVQVTTPPAADNGLSIANTSWVRTYVASNGVAPGTYASIGGSGSQPFQASGFQAAEGTSFGGGQGYSFIGDGGYDTGMFSSGDGYLQFYTNTTLCAQVDSGVFRFQGNPPTGPTPASGDNSVNIPNTSWVRSFVAGASVNYANSAGSANTANSATSATNANYATSAGTANNIPNGAGAVGTYILGHYGSASFGQTVAGSSILATDVNGDTSGPAQSGTWKCMGIASSTSNQSASTLWMRIS